MKCYTIQDKETGLYLQKSGWFDKTPDIFYNFYDVDKQKYAVVECEIVMKDSANWKPIRLGTLTHTRMTAQQFIDMLLEMQLKGTIRYNNGWEQLV